MSCIAIQRRLNPFYFRAFLKSIINLTQHVATRLNPFYFRAFLKCHTDKEGEKDETRLNPFYFRAFLK